MEVLDGKKIIKRGTKMKHTLIKINLELAKELSNFDLYKRLELLNDRVERGGFVSVAEKTCEFRSHEARIENYLKLGTSREELKWILNEWINNPISKKSCPDSEKWNMVVEELEKKLNSVRSKTSLETTKELIASHGYNEKQAEVVLETANKFVKAGEFLTLQDAVEFILKKVRI